MQEASRGKLPLHRRLGLIQAAEKPHGLRRGLGQMRGRRPQPLTLPGGIPAPNVLAFEGADCLALHHRQPTGRRLLIPGDVCHTAFAWLTEVSVGRVVGWRALWRTLRGGGCATGGDRGLLCLEPVGLFLFGVSAALGQTQPLQHALGRLLQAVCGRSDFGVEGRFALCRLRQMHFYVQIKRLSVDPYLRTLTGSTVSPSRSM